MKTTLIWSILIVLNWFIGFFDFVYTSVININFKDFFFYNGYHEENEGANEQNLWGIFKDSFYKYFLKHDSKKIILKFIGVRGKIIFLFKYKNLKLYLRDLEYNKIVSSKWMKYNYT